MVFERKNPNVRYSLCEIKDGKLIGIVSSRPLIFRADEQVQDELEKFYEFGPPKELTIVTIYPYEH